jgi:CrcB protein
MVWLLVGLGGALGSMARHFVNRAIHQHALTSTFPFGIFLINITGSFLIGLFAGVVSASRWHIPFELRTFVIVGVLGGFTTFSSFSFDTLALIRDGHLDQAVWNVAGQVGLSLIGVWVGYKVGLLTG